MSDLHIPQLTINDHGVADWDAVAVGEYVEAVIPDGPLAHKSVLIQKRADGTALIHLCPLPLHKGWTVLDTLPTEDEQG